MNSTWRCIKKKKKKADPHCVTVFVLHTHSHKHTLAHTQLAVVGCGSGAVSSVGLRVAPGRSQSLMQQRVCQAADVLRLDKPCSLSGGKTLPRTQDEGGEEDLLYRRQFYWYFFAADNLWPPPPAFPPR